MTVYTDDPRFAAIFLPGETAGRLAPSHLSPPGGQEEQAFLTDLLGSDKGLFAVEVHDLEWPFLLLREFSPRSQYDQLIELVRSVPGLPHGIACLAGTGEGFHGFKGRSWASPPGNLYLALHLAPGRPLEGFEVAFTVLAALSVLDALDQIAPLTGKSRVKWVNDILVDGAKVGGVLAYTQSQGDVVNSAVLGIGLNVDTTPEVAPTPFVPHVASVRDFLPSPDPEVKSRTLWALLRALQRNYEVLLQEGLAPLVERYRRRSLVLGREVAVYTDSSAGGSELVARGTVVDLGDRLELFLKGRDEPVTDGRLILSPGPSQDFTDAPEARGIDGAPMAAERIGW